MNSVKLLLITLAVAAFVLSCGQSASTPNTKNTAVTVPVATNNTAVNTAAKTEVNNQVKPIANKRAQLSAAAVVDEVETTADGQSPSADLYAKNCMICHKDNGKGGKVTIEGKTLKPADLTSQKIKMNTDDKLFEHISEGVPDEGMPAFKEKLAADQIKTIMTYIRELQSR